MTLWTEVAAVVAVAAGGYAVYRCGRRLQRANERRFRAEIFHDAAAWLAPRLSATPAAVEAALLARTEGGAADELLAGVLRVECEVARLSPARCRRTVLVALQSDQRVVCGRCEREVGWEDLPAEVRRHFIRHAGDVQTFVVVEGG